MMRFLLTITTCGCIFLVYREYVRWEPAPVRDQSLAYHAAGKFVIINQLPNCNQFERIPYTSQNIVRPAVWELSKYPAGLAVRFSTNSTAISLHWTLRSANMYPHITGVAARGFDLYAYTNNKWQYVGVAEPGFKKENESNIIRGMMPADREYLLNLPLYSDLETIEIGIDNDAAISKPVSMIIDTTGPVIIYGTSITQGASASRPGITYPALLSRAWNKSVVNLGFSGNGWYEDDIARAFMSCNPSAIILDCTPNSSDSIIRENLPGLLNYIRSVNDTIPIVILESFIREQAWFRKDGHLSMSYIKRQNNALKEATDRYNIIYVKGDSLIGVDHEATIDGTHLNDLGHFRLYERINRVLRR